MTLPSALGARFAAALTLIGLGVPCLALSPHKLITQYSRNTWNQEQGLPQDTVQAIAQTVDGYLWLGTAEGLVRFDGYEFVVFDKEHDPLPSNSITALAAMADGSLWIGTPSGLVHYREGRFTTFTTREGLPDLAIAELYSGHSGVLWIVAGLHLVRLHSGHFETYSPGRDIPLTSVRAVCEDRTGELWVGGFGGIAKLVGGKFETVVPGIALREHMISAMIADRGNNLWIAGSQGVFVRSAAGALRRYNSKSGLPDNLVRALREDRDGNIWAGTNGGIARFEGGRFTAPACSESQPREVVLSLFEDREGDLWAGGNNGLTRFRDDIFTVYGKNEGFPSDLPNAVFEDRAGRIWAGFLDRGLLLLSGRGSPRLFSTRDGLASDEVFAVREALGGDLLISTRKGLTRVHRGAFSTYLVRDPLERRTVYDAVQDGRGRLWLAMPGGLGELVGRRFHVAVPGGPLLSSAFGVLCAGKDDTIWAGTLGKGLWSVRHGAARQFTTADGLASNGIRSLFEDSDGVLWIGTFGGGLNALRNGKFEAFTAKDGLLSNNVNHVIDAGEYLWLSTTRGICRLEKSQLRDFAAHRTPRLTPVNYGVEDGLRSAQWAPGNFVAGGGIQSSDGRLWFPTSKGLAVLAPNAKAPQLTALSVHILSIAAENRLLDLSTAAKLRPGGTRLQIRYAAIHLSAPERIEYSYRLEGLEKEWVHAAGRRSINYNNVPHGDYRFRVRAQLPDGPAGEETYSFSVSPHNYETAPFIALCILAVLAAIAAIYRLRLQRIRNAFRLVLEERLRLAREIHDTLAQGFVGISSQLEAVAMCMPKEAQTASQHLGLAQKMARYSITEARRSVMDLRASALEKEGLAAALESGARSWARESGVDVELDIVPPKLELPREMQQQLLRIAQEAVANALKHAAPSTIRVRLHAQGGKLFLRIADDGRGFEGQTVFSTSGGHFGLVGMRERAQRVGGQLRVDSKPGRGTAVEAIVPFE